MPLVDNKYCGRTARKIYDKYCIEFGWDTSQSGKFEREKLLYAKAATPEGYDVWMLSNSNWTQTKSTHWKNTIAGDHSWIKEEWDKDPDQDSDEFVNNRVVIAKHLSYGYVFIGVFQPDSYDASTHTRVFRRISTIYPLWQ